MKVYRIPITLLPNQKKIDNAFREGCRFVVVKAGRRFGKTTYSRYKAIKECEKSESRVWDIGPTYKQIKSIVWRRFKKFIPQSAIVTKNEQELSFEFVNEAILELKGSDNPDSLRGPEEGLDFVIFEEAQLHDPFVWRDVIRIQLGDKLGKALFIYTPRGKRWPYSLFQHAKSANDPLWKAFHFTIYDNPLITKDEIQRMRTELGEAAFREECLAEEASYEGMVYPDFEVTKHIIEPFNIPNNWLKFRSIDWGKHAPLCCLWAALSPDGTVYFYDEHYQAGWDIPRHASVIKGKTSDTKIEFTCLDATCWNDDGHGGSKALDFVRLGIPVTQAANRRGDKERGIDIMTRYIRGDGKTPKVFWFSNVRNTTFELENYEWESGSEERNPKEQPRKLNDHGCDASRYLLVELSRRQLTSIGVVKNNLPYALKLPPRVPKDLTFDSETGYIKL